MKSKSSNTKASKSSFVPAALKLHIPKRHAVGVEIARTSTTLGQNNEAEPENYSKHRYIVVPAIKKRLLRKHESKD